MTIYPASGMMSSEGSASGAKTARRKYATAVVTQQREHAEQDFEKALAIARRLHWFQQRRIAAAHQLLADTYGWFTEGFNTKDLQEEKGVLDDLAALFPTLRR